jgi:hypothetical protein
MTEAAARSGWELPSLKGGSPSLHPVLVDRKFKAAYLLIPQLLERIRKFEDTYGDPTRTQTICDRFELSFRADEPFMPAAALVDSEGRVHGHVLASIEYLLGKPYLYIVQLERDKTAAAVPVETLIQMAVAFSQAYGIERLLAYPAGELQERIFIRYGLKPVARTLTLDLRAHPFGGGKNVES